MLHLTYELKECISIILVFINISFQMFRWKKLKWLHIYFHCDNRFCTISACKTLFPLVNVCYWWWEMRNNLRFDDQKTAAVGFQYIMKILVCKVIWHVRIIIPCIARKWKMLLPLYFFSTIFLHKISLMRKRSRCGGVSH